MRVDKKELMDKLGVGYDLGPYETHPWSCYDGETGQTCSAEVRMDPDGAELEAEIQMMYDEPPEGKLPMEQVFWIRSKPSASSGEWEVLDMKLRGAEPEEEIYNWQEKSCDFFSAVVQDLNNDKMPDIEEYIEMILMRKERMGDQRQGGGGKSPKIKPGELAGMKKGGGGF